MRRDLREIIIIGFDVVNHPELGDKTVKIDHLFDPMEVRHRAIAVIEKRVILPIMTRLSTGESNRPG